VLSPLHIAAEPFELWQCLIGKPDHDRPSWVAQLRARLQVKLAELVEGGDRPVCTGPHATEPERDRFRPEPQKSAEQPVVSAAH